MRSRHVAAVSLLGWYLLSPLPRADPNGGALPQSLVDADRPLHEWTKVKSFQTAGECQAYLKDWIIEQRLGDGEAAQARGFQCLARAEQADGSVSTSTYCCSTRLAANFWFNVVRPVRLPSGRFMLPTSPSSTGSPPIQKMIGIVNVAAFAASVAGVLPSAAITVTRRRTRSAASAGNRSFCPSAQRYSIATSACDVARFAQALVERAHTTRPQVRRFAAEQPNHRHRELLRTRSKRPRSRRTAKKRDELAPSHAALSRASGASCAMPKTSTLRLGGVRNDTRRGSADQLMSACSRPNSKNGLVKS